MPGTIDVQEIRETFAMKPHPEGGFYVETFRDDASSAIYFLLEAGEVSSWHRLDHAAEIWHFHAGAPLRLTISHDGVATTSFRLGIDISAGERPQAVVPAGCWQTAVTLGSWTLVGCTVAPAFDFARFELAPKGWHPGSNGGS